MRTMLCLSSLLFFSFFPAEVVAQLGFCQFIRGDADGDGSVDEDDLDDIFSPWHSDAGDVNDSGSIDTTDIVYLSSWLQNGTFPPPAPFPSAGYDCTEDNLSVTCSPPNVSKGPYYWDFNATDSWRITCSGIGGVLPWPHLDWTSENDGRTGGAKVYFENDGDPWYDSTCDLGNDWPDACNSVYYAFKNGEDSQHFVTGRQLQQDIIGISLTVDWETWFMHSRTEVSGEVCHDSTEAIFEYAQMWTRNYFYALGGYVEIGVRLRNVETGATYTNSFYISVQGDELLGESILFFQSDDEPTRLLGVWTESAQATERIDDPIFDMLFLETAWGMYDRIKIDEIAIGPVFMHLRHGSADYALWQDYEIWTIVTPQIEYVNECQ